MLQYDAAGQIGINFSFKAMFMFLMGMMILLPFVAEKKDKANEAVDPPSQGVLRVEIFWEDDANIDVDLWVKGPVGTAVGYSNLGGPLWNLLRDDLGTLMDVSGRNMEIAYTRGIWNGEYIVNAHLFNLKGGVLPVKIKVVVSYKEDEQSPSKEMFFTNQELKAGGQELTIVRFMVKDLKVDMSSLSSLQKKIRSSKAN